MTEINGVFLKLLADLETLIRRIEGQKNLSVKRFERDWKTQYVVERLIQNAVQCCLDIGARIIARKKLRPAKNYKDIFRAIHEEMWLPPSLTEKMEALVDLRNELTHEYRDIEPPDVFAAFQKIAQPLKEFFRYAKRRYK